MIKGTKLPDGDPSLQRQTEPSLAVSTRNACHLLAGANDYRIVPGPDDPKATPDLGGGMAADAWLSVLKSFDCGTTWKSTLLYGYPGDARPEAAGSKIAGYQAGADPTVRAGTNGLFYYSGIVFDRGDNGKSRLFVARFVDNNDREIGDTIEQLGDVTVVADGTSGQFVDKPWLAVDIPRLGFGSQAAYWTASDELTQTNAKTNGSNFTGAGAYCTINGQRIPGGNVYMAWARFEGNSAKDPSKIMFGRSTDCGATFETHPISSNQQSSQGATIAIAPDDGTVYVTWREFGRDGRPPSLHLMRSRDGGVSWEKPKPVIPSFQAFDQPSTQYTFRTNALPTIAAAPGGLVYIAVAARGYGTNVGGAANDDARIVLSVSTDGGRTFAAPFAIDNVPREPNPQLDPQLRRGPLRGHQLMPALAYAAGRLQVVFYDSRDDISYVRGSYISDDPAIAGNTYRHTVDVRGSWAAVDKNNPIPNFQVETNPQGWNDHSQQLSSYLRTASTKKTVQFNYVNLPMYQGGTRPFIGDYIDVQGLSAIPVRGANDFQEWRPNIPINFDGTGVSALSTQALPPLPIFHSAWADNRDVEWLARSGRFADIFGKDGLPLGNPWAVPAQCEATYDLVGIRNANLYTSRITPGLYVGSTGNTKPFGYAVDPTTGKPTADLIQRSFTVFAQNTTSSQKRFRLQIMNQPAGGRASFSRFEKIVSEIDAEIPARSSVARTVYAKSTEKYAQILIHVYELEGLTTIDPATGKTVIVYNIKPGGLQASVLLNPDNTNPDIKNFEPSPDIPDIGFEETHAPDISKGWGLNVPGSALTTGRTLTAHAPDLESPDLESDTPKAPDLESPDLESPDLESPDLESPDLESPDLESPDLESWSLGDDPSNPTTIRRIRDIHWSVQNGGNTTTAYKFRPSVRGNRSGLKFQMFVTRRYIVPVIDPNTCDIAYKTVSQVVVNVPNFQPRNPDLESPDLESPDLESPDLESPDLESASLNNVTFALAPSDEATLTLRVFQVESAPPAGGADDAGAGGAGGDDADPAGADRAGATDDAGSAVVLAAERLAAQDECTILDDNCVDETTNGYVQAIPPNSAGGTLEAQPESDVSGADLEVSTASVSLAGLAPGSPFTLSATISNAGTDPTTVAEFNTRFFLSTDPYLTFDAEHAITDVELTPHYAHNRIFAAGDSVSIVQGLTIPRTTTPGSYYVLVYTDADRNVFEGDDFLPANETNNVFAIPVTVAFYLTFAAQPTTTTEDFTIAPAVVVDVLDGAGALVPAGDVLAVTLSLSGGAATLGGTLTQPNGSGVVAFSDLYVNNPGTYTLIASAPGSYNATSTPFVIEVDDPPVAVNDGGYVTTEDQPLAVTGEGQGSPPGVLENDTDETKTGPGTPRGQVLTAVLVSQPSHGSVALTEDGTYNYTPAANYNGPDGFTYRANDTVSNGNIATVSITVLPVNDSPTATSQAVATDEDIALPIVLSGTDTETSLANLSFTIVSGPSHGSLSGTPPNVSYTPGANYNGADSFTFTVTDRGDPDGCSGGACSAALTSGEATVNITVRPVNDTPQATAQSVTTNEDTALEVTLAGADIETTPASLSFAIVTGPAHGTLSGAPPNVTYTPAANYNGADSFTFTVTDRGDPDNCGAPVLGSCDSVRTSAAATVSINVSAVNDAPVAQGQSVTTSEDTAKAITLAATDVDSEGLAYSIAAGPSNGTLAGTPPNVTYTPGANFYGQDSFTFKANDGTLDSNVATVSIAVNAVNDAPVANDQSVLTNEDTPVAITLTASDVDSAALTFSVVTPPAHGQLTGSAPNLTYTPAPNYFGPDAFTFKANDSLLDSNVATVSIAVTPVTEPPVAVDDAAETSEDTPVTIDVLANDADVDEDALTVISVTTPAHGTAVINQDSTVTYTPAANFFGEDSFDYTVSDGQGGTDTATVTVAVSAVDDAPTAVDDAASAPTGAPVSINVVANDADPETAPAATLVASEAFLPAGFTFNIGFVNEIARVAQTGYLYVSGGRGIAAIDPATYTPGTAVPTIDLASGGIGAATFHQVNDSTSIVYFRHGPNIITAIDGRPGSATFNQVVARLQLGGTINAFAIDESRGVMYVTNSGSNSQVPFQARLTVVDVDPARATFHESVAHVELPSNARGVAVDAANDRVYVALDSGLGRIDSASLPGRTLSVMSTGGLLEVLLHGGNVYGYGGGGRLAGYEPASGTVRTFSLTNFTTGFTAGKRFVVHGGTGRLFLRSSGAAGAAGKIAVLATSLASWTSPATPLLAELTNVGRDTGPDLVVDEGRNLVMALSSVDNQVAFIPADADPATMNGAIQVLPLSVGSDAELDASAGRLYATNFAMVRAIDVDSRTPVTAIAAGAEGGFAAALPGPAGSPNTRRFFVSRTSLGTGMRSYSLGGAASSLTLAHDVGRIVFAAGNTQTNRLYVVNTSANATGSASTPGSVSVIDGATGGLLTTVDVGNLPFGIGINETTNKIYVGNGGAGFLPGGISVIDGVTHQVTGASVPGAPGGSTAHGVFPVNTLFGRHISPLCLGPGCATVNKVFIQANKQTGVISVAVLDGATNTVTELPAAAGVTNANVVRASGALNRVFVGNLTDGAIPDVIVINGTTEAKITTLRGVSSPSTAFVNQAYLAVDEARSRVYTADFLGDRLFVLDASVEAGCDASQFAPSATCYPVLAAIATGDGPTVVGLDPTANRIYVGNTNDETLTVIDGASFKVVGTLSLPLPPTSMAVDASTPSVTHVFMSASFLQPGAMLVADTHGGGGLMVAPGTLTQGAFGATAINADGTVQYTPNAAYSGPDTFRYRVTDGASVSVNEATVTVTVGQPLTISTAALPDPQIGNPYAQTLAASGGTPPYTWRAFGALPGGLTFYPVSAMLAGIPTQSGTYLIRAQVQDSSTPQQAAMRDYTLVIGPLVIATTGLPSAFVGTFYSQPLVAGGTTQPVTWTLNTNNNPTLGWLSLSQDGTLSGTPTTYGTSASFTVSATAGSDVAQRTYTIFVNALLDVAVSREGIVLENQPSLLLIGGNGTRTVTLTDGALPPGLALNANGSFTGQPTRHGTFNFTVEIRDCSPSTSCAAGTPQQVVTKDLTMRVSAKDQQGSSQSQPGIGFGGLNGRRMAQVVTVGAQGTLTAIGLRDISCPSVTPVTVEVQRLSLNGQPDGTTIASGTATTNYNAITVSPPVGMAIGERFAFIVSSPVACTFNNAPASDFYNGGDAYVDAGGGWVTLLGAEGRYDLPSFRTLIQPAMDVAYLRASRGGLTATLLASGKVLIVGASNSITADLYDPTTHTSALTTGSLGVSRQNLTATLLTDGRVLVVGGRDQSGVVLSTAEIYDPATDTFSPTGSMATPRENHTATRLPDGRVLIAGGQSSSASGHASVEIYDPGTGTFNAAGNMSTPRSSHTATLLASGKVLLAGGYYVGSVTRADLFDPGTGLFTQTAGNMVVHYRGRASATLLLDGRVLIAGGEATGIRNEAEIYDPATDSFAATAGVMTSKRFWHTATLLADGSVLIAGGYDQNIAASYIPSLATAERYLPGTDMFVSAGGIETRRHAHAAVRLPSNKVLLVGGFAQTWMSGNTAELYDAAAMPVLATTSLPDGQVGVQYPSTQLAAGGGSGAPYQIDLVGGALAPGLTYDSNTFTLSGTPSAMGFFPLAFQVTDGAGAGNTQTLTLRVGSLNTITSPYRLPDAALNQAYAVQLTATGVEPITWTVLPASNNPLPPGLFLAVDGLFGGAPTSLGYYTFAVRAVDALGVEAVKVHAINVVNPLTITTTSLGDGILGNAYGSCMSWSGGISPLAWTLSGDYPQGLAFNSNNQCFNGSWPAQQLLETGTFTFTVTVTDSSVPPQADSKEFTIQVHAPEQQSWGQASSPITLDSTRRFAQVFTAGTGFDLTALQLFNIWSCTGNTTIMARVYPVTGAPARPDDSGDPLATAMVTASSNGGFNNTLRLSTPVPIPHGGRFAVVLEFAGGSCQGQNWSVDDTYPRGDGWVDTGAGWQLLSAVVGRSDMSMGTAVMPQGLTYLTAWRHGAATVTLQDGRVLIAGGYDQRGTADIYDPVTRTVTPTGGMSMSRANATATLLDAGRVAIIGGQTWNQATNMWVDTASVELFDPEGDGGIGTFESGGGLSVARQQHTATLVTTAGEARKILVAGGWSSTTWQQIQSAELYDPSTQSSSTAFDMVASRSQHTATLLANGKVLVAGGWIGGPWPAPFSELFDPADESFSAVPDNPEGPWRSEHAAVLLTAEPHAGKVMLIGGSGFYPNLAAATDLFDPATSSWSAGPSLVTPRMRPTATLLAGGRVVVAGGSDSWVATNPVAAVEVYDPAPDQFTAGPSLAVDRQDHVAHLVITGPDAGKVFAAAGWSYSWLTARSGELVDVTAAGSALAITTNTLPDGAVGTAYPGAALAASGGSGAGYTFDLIWGELPPGLTFANGQIGGTPTAGGPYSFVVRVTDSAGHTAFGSFTIVVNRLTVASPQQLTNATAGVPYAYQLQGAGVGTLVWTLEPGNALPPGLGLSGGGLISGTPTASGFFWFNIRVADASGQFVVKNFNIQVSNAGPTAVDDNAQTEDGGPVTIAVLANDTDPDGHLLDVIGITQPANGTAVLNGDDTITYTRNGTFLGEDTFTYTIGDGYGGNASATVRVGVTTNTFAPGTVLVAHRTTAGSYVISQITDTGFLLRQFGAQDGDEFRSHLALSGGSLFRSDALGADTISQFAEDGTLIRTITPTSSAQHEIVPIARDFLNLSIFGVDTWGGTNVVRHLDDPSTGAMPDFAIVYFSDVAGIADLYFDTGTNMLFALAQRNPASGPYRVAKIDAAGTQTFYDSADFTVAYVFDVGSVAVNAANGNVHVATTANIVTLDAAGNQVGMFAAADNKPSLDVDASGNIYFGRFDSGQISVYSPAGALIRTIVVPSANRIVDVLIIR
jgi:hypothetical protein